jgi:hypothetical protein
MKPTAGSIAKVKEERRLRGAGGKWGYGSAALGARMVEPFRLEVNFLRLATVPGCVFGFFTLGTIF